MKYIADANDKCPTLPKMFNSKTSKQSIGTIAFNDDGWGCTTRSFTASTIKKAQSVVKFKAIERVAKEFSKGNTHVWETLSTSDDPWDRLDHADEWAKLADNHSVDD